MRVLLLSNYYYPEEVGAGIWVRQLAIWLRDHGHTVCVVTSFPSYPGGEIFPKYRGQSQLREVVDGIEIFRTYTYATRSKSFWPRFISFGAFCASSATANMSDLAKPDVIYAILPPLPLGGSAWFLSRLTSAPMVINIQDVYPDIAISTGYLKNKAAIRFFTQMEKWIYKKSSHIVLISEGFRQNLLAKHVPAEKISVVPNWADSAAIRPGPKDNLFRRQLGVGDEFLVVYSGGLTHNSYLQPVLKAAQILSNEPIRFAIIGEGVQSEDLQRMAANLSLRNTRFLPFQPINRYPEVLAAADVTLVTLHANATFASVPSKIYKQMAAGRAVLAITNGPNELTRLIHEAGCGYWTQPDDLNGFVEVLRRCMASRAPVARLGANGRAYLENECELNACARRIEQVLMQVSAQNRMPGSYAAA